MNETARQRRCPVGADELKRYGRTIGLLFVSISFFLLGITVITYTPNCTTCRARALRVGAAVLCSVGLLMMVTAICLQRRSRSANAVLISVITERGQLKSSTPVLSQQPFIHHVPITAASPPRYGDAVNSPSSERQTGANAKASSVTVETNDKRDPLPSYEQALELMQHDQEQYAKGTQATCV